MNVDSGHMVFIPPEETQQILAQPHCFSFLNYVCKPSSQSTPIWPVCNSSSYHISGSCNSNLPAGPCLISNLKSIFYYFTLKPYLLLSDLSKVYRTIRTTHSSNMMHLHAYPEDINDPNSAFLILLLLRLPYGDVIASCVLELIMKEILAPLCTSDLAKVILIHYRYIDDMVALGWMRMNFLLHSKIWRQFVIAMDSSLKLSTQIQNWLKLFEQM